MAELARKTLSIDAQPYRAGSDAAVVGLLNDAFGDWGNQADWRWKHLQRPGFKPSDILLYTDGDRVVGCVHLAFQNLTLEPGLVVPYCIEGDLAVHPQYRRGGLMLRARDDAKERISAGGAVLGIGFAVRSMHERVYRKAFGHTAVADGTTRYRKIVSARQLCQSLEKSGQALASRAPCLRLLREGPLRIQLRIAGFAPCQLTLSSEGARCVEGDADDCDLAIAAPYQLLTCTRGPRLEAVQAILKSVLTGQLRVRGVGALFLRCLRVWVPGLPGRAS
jgi:predicted N-acetyltransferase YhbS